MGPRMDPKYTYMCILNVLFDQIYFGYIPLIYIKKRSRQQNEIDKLTALAYIVDVRLSQGDYVYSVNDQTLINFTATQNVSACFNVSSLCLCLSGG